MGDEAKAEILRTRARTRGEMKRSCSPRALYKHLPRTLSPNHQANPCKSLMHELLVYVGEFDKIYPCQTCQDFSHTPIACSGFSVFGSGGSRGGARRAERKNLGDRHPPPLSHGLVPPLFRTLLYLVHPPPRSDELALYRELPTPPTSG